MVDGRFQCLINVHTDCLRFPCRIIHLPHLSSPTHLGSIIPKSQSRDIAVFGKPNKCRWRSSESAGQILFGFSSNAGYSEPATNATWPTTCRSTLSRPQAITFPDEKFILSVFFR
ncbi:predicted protein [Verticillium alfalfae VaMs.102]|uniref:Predicted protein n=1 Tax=Verticillium alfalfae (strain VaMs.102 / ATCC MYA-4576 / FGSC 10136) TaxID=526221 RepID=C9SCX0_VERA1|nr:predicted protein [Verticillium alfalfae VaMs.102]EEY16935.1 predicted protein [Verticillium alfalfae VaMs.102]